MIFLRTIILVISIFLLTNFCYSQESKETVNDLQKPEKSSEIVTLDSKLCFNPEKKKPKLKAYKNYIKTKKGKTYFSDCCPIQVHKINNPTPIYPASAKFVNAKGRISVRVFVNEKGKVFWAEVESGHPLLRAIALKTACRTIFKPYVCYCGKKEVRQFQTIISYDFV